MQKNKYQLLIWTIFGCLILLGLTLATTTVSDEGVYSNNLCYSNGSNCNFTTASTYNSTYDLWSYNQTAPANSYTDSKLTNYYNKTDINNFNSSWSSTYNSTYAQWAYNQSDGYLSSFDYNHTAVIYNTYGIWFYNQSTPFYNWLSTFAYNYNQTSSANSYTDSKLTNYYNKTDINNFNSSWSSTYNATYSTTTSEWNGNKTALLGTINNASYLSTYNSTYAQWAYNQSDGVGTGNLSFNQTLTDSLYLSQSQINTTQFTSFLTLDVTWLENFIKALTKWNDYYDKSQIDSFNESWSSTYNSTYDAKVSFNNTNIAYTNKTNNFTANQNFNGNNITQVSYITLTQISGACDLTLNGSICSNDTGTYIVG